MTEDILYEDRSGAETDDTCGMKYWWSRLEGVRGIAPKEEGFALKVGRETHEDLALIAELDDQDLKPEPLNEMVSQILAPIGPDDLLFVDKMEVLYRRLGWMVAFALYVEPRIREKFTTIQIEKELILDRTPLWVGTTPDRVLEHNEDHYLVYKEYKSTITAGQKWIQSWPFAIQIHIGLAAAEEELGRKVAFGQVMGLMKGDTRSGRLSHPYVWGWRNSSNGAWTHEYDKARSANWAPAPVWEYEGGLVKWVQNCGPEVGLAMFPHSAPIFLNTRMLDDWVQRRLYRQTEIAMNLDACRKDPALRKILFPMQTRSCRPPFGDPCPFLKCCWNAATQSAPLADPDFVPRSPHHDVELEVERINVN